MSEPLWALLLCRGPPCPSWCTPTSLPSSHGRRGGGPSIIYTVTLLSVAIEAVLGNEGNAPGALLRVARSPAGPVTTRAASVRLLCTHISGRRGPRPTSGVWPGGALRPSPPRPRARNPAAGLLRSPHHQGWVSSGTWDGECRLVDSTA